MAGSSGLHRGVVFTCLMVLMLHQSSSQINQATGFRRLQWADTPRDVAVKSSLKNCTDWCTVKVNAGQSYEFKCQSLASKPASTLRWTLRNGSQTTNVDAATAEVHPTKDGAWDATSTVSLKVLPSHHQMSLVCSVLYPNNRTSFREIEIKLLVDKRSLVLTVMLIAGCSLAILITGCIIVYAAKYFRMHKNGRQGSNRSEPDHPPDIQRESDPHPEVDITELTQEQHAGARCFPRDRITILNKVGEDSFGVVYKATADGIVEEGRQSTVAVKMLKTCTSGSSSTADFMRELDVCKTLQKHPNVITMLGSCTEKEPYCLIFEFAPHGSLDKFLKQKKREWTAAECREGPVSSEQIMKFACQTASGMDYLSSMKIIHRDLAARNILLGEGLTCKLSDFGFSRDVIFEDHYEMSSDGAVPIRWMALESIVFNKYTTKSDVWSYGVLLWEIITMGSHPYPGMEVTDIVDALRNGRRLAKPPFCSDKLYKVMKECWHPKPNHRPEFHDILQTLESMRGHSSKYLQMSSFTPDN